MRKGRVLGATEPEVSRGSVLARTQRELIDIYQQSGSCNIVATDN